MPKEFSAALILLGALVFAPLANADITFSLNQNECCVAVELHQANNSTVQVTVTLTSGEFFADTGSGNHPGFAFNLTGDPAIDITNLTSGFTVGGGAVSTNGPSFGNLDYFLNVPGHGTNAHENTLSFDVSLAAGGNLPLSVFSTNASGYYFVADILGQDGQTGLAAGDSPGVPSIVPEPTGLVLLSSSMIGIGIIVRRRRSRRVTQV